MTPLNISILMSLQTPKNLSLRLIIFYRPQKSKDKRHLAPIFFQEFGIFLEDIASTPGRLPITGDFNFHVDDLTDREASIFMDMITSAGLTQYVTEPTHIDGHTLDLIITRTTDSFVSNVNTTSYLPSDHSAVLCGLNIARENRQKLQSPFVNFAILI